jgi:hypothetical protein
MQVCRSTTIDGYNEYLKGLRSDTATKYHVSLTQFDAPTPMANPELTVCYIDKPLTEVPDLTAEQYQPRGNTPLYDAIGEVLRRLEGKVNGRPVLDVILTDGLENASQEFTKDAIKALIAQKEKEGHTFVFLGANIDSYAVGASMGIPTGNISNYAPGNEVCAFAAVADCTSAYSGARRASLSARQTCGESFLSDHQRSVLIGKPTPLPHQFTLTGVSPSGGTARPFPVRRSWSVSQQ